RGFAATAVAEMAPHLGRLVVASEKSAAASISPGCVFPVVVHGGPGRAGGGAELGGVTGLALYMQRTTIQGGGSQLARML
ncbi:MAG: phenylacetic acid degradation bifunctional protein PaaZ, partial [Pseudomonadales bacterium]